MKYLSNKYNLHIFSFFVRPMLTYSLIVFKLSLFFSSSQKLLGMSEDVALQIEDLLLEDQCVQHLFLTA